MARGFEESAELTRSTLVTITFELEAISPHNVDRIDSVRRTIERIDKVRNIKHDIRN